MPKLGQLPCRPEQFAGAWACEEQALDAYEAAALSILSSGQLEVVALASREMDDPEDKGYLVDADGIARVPVSGMLTKYPSSFRSRLGGSSYIELQSLSRNLVSDPSVKGVLVEMDSPGGLTTGVEEASAAFANIRKSKPLEIHIHGLGCSAAYRLAAEADHITADPTSMIGSIGTRLVVKDLSEAYRKAGVKLLHYASGEHKLDGAPGNEVTPSQSARFQSLVDESGQRFADAISDRRTITDAQKTTIMQGGVYWGPKAKTLGLVDAIGFTDDALSHLKQRIASGGSGRAGLAHKPDPAANPKRHSLDRSIPMPLSAEQLTQAKSLPGCGDITADNAPERLLATATSLQNVAAGAATENTRLAGELSQAKALATASAPASPREIAMARTLAQSKIQSLSGTKLSPACATALATALVGSDAAPVVAALTPDAKGVTLASTVLEALASNEGILNASGQQQTGAQPVARTVPGEPIKMTDAEFQAEVDKNLARTDLGRRALASRNGH